MNIGIVTTWFERGAAYVSRAYMDAFAAASHHVYIYARGGERYGRGAVEWDLACVTWAPRLGCRAGGVVFDLNHLARWLSDRRIDVVLFNEERNWHVVRLCKRLGYPVGAYVDYYTPASVRFFDAYDFLVCNTRRHSSVFQDHAHCIHVPWGTDTELFRPNGAAPTSPVRFFHSAGVSPFRKGTDLAIRAFHQINGDARLIIHTQKQVADWECETDLLDDPRITVIVRTVPAPGLYHLGNVYVYPSRLDGVGLTLCEALACGLPAIATDEPPMNEFVIDGLNGLLVPVASRRRRPDSYYWPMATADVSELSARMQWYVDDPSRVTSQARQARQSAEERFCWQKNAAGLADRIAGLVDQDRKRKPALGTRVAWTISGVIDRVRATCIAGAKRALRKDSRGHRTTHAAAPAGLGECSC
ncbi:MAG: glycosyltransferase family 4 protein [Verrucomicrobia bacterium]|nr:glycosyltransferase family 4 protein [Verrucomicrobiota bacterium]